MNDYSNAGHRAWVIDGLRFWMGQFEKHAVPDNRAIWEVTTFIRWFNQHNEIN